MLKAVEQPSANPLTELYSVIRKELEQVETLLASELTNSYQVVNDLLAKCKRLSGKRLRPSLLLLFAKACDGLQPAHIKLAAAIEMVHTATLVHDDILDSADQRRHSKTINCEYGNQVAILTGDFLFSHAFYLTTTLPTTYAAQEIGLATNKVCEGEIRQVSTKKQYEVTEDHYLEIIDAKTAVLCSCAAKLGAHYANATDEQVAAAACYGTHLGIAFQIVDDLLDITGSEAETGKSLGTDLRQHKPTLPIIHHLAQLNEQDRASFVNDLIDDKLPQESIVDVLNETMSLAYAEEKAQEHAQKAVDSLKKIGEPSDALKVLQGLPSLLLHRRR